MEAAFSLEMNLNQTLLYLHTLHFVCPDLYLCGFLEEQFLDREIHAQDWWPPD